MRSQHLNSHKEPNNLAPGGFKANLTLTDVLTVLLASALRILCLVFLFATQPVYKLNTSQLPFPVQLASLYNAITTLKGEMYAIVLGDGSKVWLNSESSIKYPVAFSGNRHRVRNCMEIWILPF